MFETVEGNHLFGQGYKRFQIKVGADADVDIERIRRCHAAVAKDRDCVVWPDGNTGITYQNTVEIA